jgi:membrane protease YdiL (CAAX protease family)
MSPESLGHWRLIGLAALFEGGLALVAWGAAWLLDIDLWSGLRWDTRDAALGVAAAGPMLVLFWVCLRLRWSALERIRRLCAEIIRPLFAPCTKAELALLSLLAGFGEETLFRGVLQAALAEWLGTWAGLTLASVVFGLLHALTATYAVLATLMGVYLGAVWLATDNLLVVIVAHGLYDFVALIYLAHGPPLDTPSPSSPV